MSQPVFLASDLNLLHRWWQPSLQRGQTAFAESFITWLDQSQLVFISEVDRPTHDEGNVLDLAFAFASARILFKVGRWVEIRSTEPRDMAA